MIVEDEWWRETHRSIPSNIGQDWLVLTSQFLCSAEVIKVEHPTRGDDTRAWGPPFAKYRQGDDARHVGPPFAENVKENPKGNLKGPGESAYFIAVSLGDLCAVCCGLWDKLRWGAVRR